MENLKNAEIKLRREKHRLDEEITKKRVIRDKSEKIISRLEERRLSKEKEQVQVKRAKVKKENYQITTNRRLDGEFKKAMGGIG